MTKLHQTKNPCATTLRRSVFECVTDGAIYTPAPPHLRRTSLRTRANKRMLSANGLPLRCLMLHVSNARASHLLGADTNRGAARAV